MEYRNATLFWVDDDPAARDIAQTVATSLGLACEAFASADAFLRRFDPSLAGCLVTNLRLADMDGLQLQGQLLNRGSALPVIFVTACANVTSAVQAMQNGAVTVLEKPCPAGQLESAVRTALERGRRARALGRQQTDLRLRFDLLEPRERETMALIVHGLPNKTIARELGVSQRTVDRIRAEIFAKMGAQSAVDLAGIAGELWRLPRGADLGSTVHGEVA